MIKNPDAEYQDEASSLPLMKACLKVLAPFPAGDAIYILSVICPDASCALQLARTKFQGDVPPQEWPSEPIQPSQSQQEDALEELTSLFEPMPEEQAREFWIGLAIAWINAYPPDPDTLKRYKGGDAARFNAALLRTRLIDSILGIY